MRRKCIILIIIGATGYALFSPPVLRAQVNNWMGAELLSTVNTARWKLGRLWSYAAFRLGDVGYDSDIYFGFSPTPVPNYRFTAGPDIRVFVPLRKNKIILDVSEIPQYLYFFQTKEERALNNTFKGQFHWVLNRFYLQAGGGLADTRMPLSAELSIYARRKENRLHGLFLWQLTMEASVGIQVRQTKYHYVSPAGTFDIGEILNRKETYINLRAYLQQLSRTRFFLDSEYGIYQFSKTVSSSRDSRSYGVFAGLEFIPPPSGRAQTHGIQGRVNVGYKYFNILNPLTKDYGGLVGNTGVTIGIFRLTALRGLFARDVHFSTYHDNTYFLQTVYGVGIMRYLSRRILLAYDYYFSKNVYPSGEAGGALTEAIDFSTHAIRVRLTLSRDLELNLLGSLGRRSLGSPLQINRRNFIGFSLIYGTTSGDTLMITNPISQYFY
jgi:hypothetical protein